MRSGVVVVVVAAQAVHAMGEASRRWECLVPRHIEANRAELLLTTQRRWYLSDREANRGARLRSTPSPSPVAIQ
jgi:hypothetical protein